MRSFSVSSLDQYLESRDLRSNLCIVLACFSVDRIKTDRMQLANGKDVIDWQITVHHQGKQVQELK